MYGHSGLFFLFLTGMKLIGLLLCMLLAATTPAFSQIRQDSSFSLLFNGGESFTHANDPHINRWLQKYGYPAEPHVPSSINMEVDAIPASSRLLYSIRLSTINSGSNLSSFNISAGLYTSLIKTRNLLFLVGGNVGLHGDIITLNGNLPPEYQQLAAQYHTPLALRRRGLFVEPAARAYWFPLRFNIVQVGFYGGLGYDLDLNSQWKLGYYSNNHGDYSHFRGLGKPSDQQRVSEHGFSLGGGLTIRINLH
jgi:hypothetical protein